MQPIAAILLLAATLGPRILAAPLAVVTPGQTLGIRLDASLLPKSSSLPPHRHHAAPAALVVPPPEPMT